MASTAIVTGGEQVSVSRVLSRGVAVIRDNPATVFGIAFLFGALPSLIFSWFQQGLRIEATDRYSAAGAVAVSLVSMIVSLILLGLVQGALVRATIAFTERRRASFAECASIGLSFALPVVGLMILLVIAVYIGLIFLIVPGVILFVMWAVASPALVAERTGVFGAFGRSRQLTKGARWKVFGVELIIMVISWVIYGVVAAGVFRSLETGGAAEIARNGLPFGWLVLNAVISTFVNAFWSTVQTSLYVELRNWKDGHSDQALEEIFA